MNRLRAGAALLFVAASAACGADPPVDCLSAPQSCGPGMTCWPTDMGGSFACMASKSYAPLGTECAILVGLTTCADGLICAPMTGGPNNAQTNRCTQYCDAMNPCPSGAACAAVTLFPIGPSIAVCILPPT